MSQTPTLRLGPRIVSLVVGYGAGCVVAAIAVATMFFLSGSDWAGAKGPEVAEVFGMLAITLLFLVFIALPGFGVLRIALWWLGRQDLISFVAIGAVNGVFASLMMIGLAGESASFAAAFSLRILGPGALGGAATWAVERWLSKKFAVKASAT